MASDERWRISWVGCSTADYPPMADPELRQFGQPAARVESLRDKESSDG